MPADDELTPIPYVPSQLVCDDRLVLHAPSTHGPARHGPPDAESHSPGSLRAGTTATADRLLRALAAAGSVPELLDTVADLAVAAVRSADAAVICVVRDNAPATFAASRGMITMLDATQYATGEGPCFEAMCTCRTVQVDDVAGWDGDGWRELAGTYDVAAALAMPIAVTPDTAATLSLYRYSPGGWSPADVAEAAAFAAQLADLLSVADRLTDTSPLIH